MGLTPVKLNMVVFRPMLPHIPEMIRFVSRNSGLRLQLIQFMPELVGPKDWSVDIDGVKRWLESRADKVLVREMHHRHIYQFGGAEVELVDPVYNREFCMNCHRIRITHQGELKGCLNRNDYLIPTPRARLPAATAGVPDRRRPAGTRTTAAMSGNTLHGTPPPLRSSSSTGSNRSRTRYFPPGAGGPTFPYLVAITSPTIATASSSGVFAPMSSPIGTWIACRNSGETPFAARPSRSCFQR